MLTVTISDGAVAQFNLRDYETEEKFKEVALNHAIDQSGIKLRIRFRHADHDKQVMLWKLDTSIIRKIEVDRKRFYENGMYYSFKTIHSKEDVCR